MLDHVTPGGRRARRWSLLALLALTSCVEVSGGAVEARWDLRNPDGARRDCVGTPVAALRFQLLPLLGGDDPCRTSNDCAFACEVKTGATRFVIPEGDYMMNLMALDSSGSALGPPGVVAPEPVTRRVVHGQVTDLNVNLIIVSP